MWHVKLVADGVYFFAGGGVRRCLEVEGEGPRTLVEEREVVRREGPGADGIVGEEVEVDGEEMPASMETEEALSMYFSISRSLFHWRWRRRRAAVSR